MDLMERVLAVEGYVEVSPAEKATYIYSIAYGAKEEIRKHAWIENEKGRGLNWDQARVEWTTLYFNDYFKRLRLALKPKKKTVKLPDYARRVPMATGHIV